MSYKCLTVNDAEIGQEVILVNPSPHYLIGGANPVVCSRYECCGIVSGILKSRISVKWDNGTRNTYKNNELTLAIYRRKILFIKQSKPPTEYKGIEWDIMAKTEKRENIGEYTSIWLKRMS